MVSIIAFTSEFHPLRGGIGVYAEEMARAAAALGHKFTLVAPDYGRYNEEHDNEAYDFTVKRFHAGRHSFRDSIDKFNVVHQALQTHDYDVVHAIDWPFYIPVRLCAGKSRIVCTLHGSEVIVIGRSFRRIVAHASKLFSPTTEFIANSNFTKNLATSEWGIDECSLNIKTVLLGVSNFWFSDGLEGRELRASNRQKKLVILTAARLTPRKGHLRALEVLASLPEELKTKFTYIIAGPLYDLPFVSLVKTAALRSGCDVRILGEVSNEELRSLYSLADVFLLVAVPVPNGPVEGFGLVYLEAGASGVPSIAGTVGGASEAIQDGVTGIIVNPADTVQYRSAIVSMVTDHERRSHMSEQALVRSRSLSWEHCVAETYRLPFVD